MKTYKYMLSLLFQELNIHTITFYITITDILKTLVRAQNNFYMIITLYHVLVMDVHLYSILKLCQGFFYIEPVSSFYRPSLGRITYLVHYNTIQVCTVHRRRHYGDQSGY